jgi:hypothetical protein
MKIAIASFVSAITTSVVGVALLALSSVWYPGFFSESAYGFVVSLGCVAAPATALHLCLQKKKMKEPYLVYAIVGALGVTTFFLLRPFVLNYSIPFEKARPAFIALVTAAFVGGLAYRASVGVYGKPRKTA